MKRYPRVTVPHHDSDGLSLRLTFCKFNVDCQWELKVDGLWSIAGTRDSESSGSPIFARLHCRPGP